VAKRQPATSRRGTRVGKYRSKYEAEVARLLEESGRPVLYEAERVLYTLPRVYVPDFILPSGVIVEAKGYMPSADRTKMIAVRDANPHLDIRFLFQNANNKLRKSSKTTYGQWATRSGFVWAEGPAIPKDW
jgi:hypothetical protein